MKSHRNAKTNVYQRQLLIRRVRQLGWTRAAAAQAAGVSVRTVAKWLTRATALADRSSRPHRQTRELAQSVTNAIVALRQTKATAWQISAALGVPRSTVTRVLARAGLNRIACLTPRPVVQRYEWPHAGDLVHLDIKRLGRITGIGHRIHGDRARTPRGGGWEFVHVAIDDATRLAYVEVRRSPRVRTCVGFLARAGRWFQRCGIRVRRILSDNGSAYRSRVFARACHAQSIRHHRTRPYTPRTNGKAERFIQTLLREWAYRFPYLSSHRRTAALIPYLRFYNRRRPHTSLGRRSPWTRFQEAA
jgi:transposase InsO family protein